MQLRVKHVDNDSGVFWAMPVNDDFCCDEMSFNRSSRSVVASGESAQHRWRPMRSAEEEQQEEEQQEEEQQEEEQQQQEEEEGEEEEPEQCERNPLCTRGYKHGGKGGKCSVPREVEEETEEKEDEHSDDVASIAPEEALRQAAAEGLELEKSERSASGYKGVYPSGPRFVASVMQGPCRLNLNPSNNHHPFPGTRPYRSLLPSQARKSIISGLLQLPRKRHSHTREHERLPPTATTTTTTRAMTRWRRSWTRRQHSALRKPKGSHSRRRIGLPPGTRAFTNRAAASRRRTPVSCTHRTKDPPPSTPPYPRPISPTVLFLTQVGWNMSASTRRRKWRR